MEQTKIIVKPGSKGEQSVKDLYAIMQDFKKKGGNGKIGKTKK